MREAGFKQAGFRCILRGDDKPAVVVTVRLCTPGPLVGLMIKWTAIHLKRPYGFGHGVP